MTDLADIDRKAREQDNQRQATRARLAAKTSKRRTRLAKEKKERKARQKQLESQPTLTWFNSLGGEQLVQCLELRRATDAQLNKLQAFFPLVCLCALFAFFKMFYPFFVTQDLLNSLKANDPLTAVLRDAMRRKLLEHWDSKKYGKFRGLDRLRKLYW